MTHNTFHDTSWMSLGLLSPTISAHPARSNTVDSSDPLFEIMGPRHLVFSIIVPTLGNGDTMNFS